MRLTNLVPIFPALILAACSGGRTPPPNLDPVANETVEQPVSTGPAQGIDLASDASDVLNELQGSGVKFVARYYRDPISDWPPLSAAEARRLSALGIKIVAVWESHSGDPAHFNYDAGYDDARAADREAKAVGQPAGSAIYFAVDYDAPPEALPSIEQYFRGVAAGLAAAGGGNPSYEIGVYGSGVVCDAIKDAGFAQYSWLSNSMAWAGSLGYDGWNIKQGGPAGDLSFNQDSDKARAAYGGFRIAEHFAAAPYHGGSAIASAGSGQPGVPVTASAAAPAGNGSSAAVAAAVATAPVNPASSIAAAAADSVAAPADVTTPQAAGSGQWLTTSIAPVH